jgi:transposase
MGRSRGGLTFKIHALVGSNGLPVRLALTPGEAHDNRLAGKLLSRLKSKLMLHVVSHDAARSGVVRRTKERSEWSMVLPKPFAVDEGLFKKCALPTSVHDLQ